MTWKEYLKENVLDWLFEEENPSVRYWALQHLLDKKFDESDVLSVQEKIMNSHCVRAILDAQSNDGFWGNPDDMYNPKYRAATHNLLILAELGAKRSPEIERAIEHLFLFQRTSGHFLGDLPKTAKGQDSAVKDGCCLDGNILFYMIHFGYLEDSRVQKLIQFQIDYYAKDEGGWMCRAYPIDSTKVFPKNCYMGRVKMLRALAEISQKKQIRELREIIAREVEVVLENGIYRYLRNPDGTRKEKAGWKRFGFPLFYQSDILEVLDTLTRLGAKDERMQDSIDIVLNAQQKDGTWLLKDSFNGKMLCDIEEKNKSSKWITLRALRVLKRYYS
jgi:hypothetical protein